MMRRCELQQLALQSMLLGTLVTTRVCCTLHFLCDAVYNY
jgi:hypothetical protein